MQAASTDAERRAVDGVLGEPSSAWEGGDHSALDGHIARGGAAARGRRHLLLPALHALQGDIGWISPGGLNYVSERLTVPPAEAFGVASFYALFATEERPGRVAHLCDDVACRTAGAGLLCAGLEAELGPEGSGEGDTTWLRSPCLGGCERAPAVLYQLANGEDWTEGNATTEGVLAALAGERGSVEVAIAAPQTPDDSLRLLGRVGLVPPGDLGAYRDAGGYRGLARSIELGAEGVVTEIIESGLLGRGGAAFPAGVKWKAVAEAPETPHYLICNADESEPGTFKDRLLLEQDPFAIIEGMTIAAYATGCEYGYVYIRGEYPEAARRLEAALDQARAVGLLGDDIMDSGFSFDAEVRRGAGAYICGEETALMESIEGRRGEPRQKPPFPTQAGLFARPTLVNNVETLCNVASIVAEGGASFAAGGSGASTGTRLFCLSGAVERPGVYEIALGETLGSLLEMAGSTRDLGAILLGGAAGSFVTDEILSMPLTFEAAREQGVTLGSGAIVVFDAGTDFYDIVSRIAAFFRDESCGQCVPCRVGTVRQEEALARIGTSPGVAASPRPNPPPEGQGELRDADIGLISDIARAMADASICGLGHTASSAVQSALRLGLVGGGS